MGETPKLVNPEPSQLGHALNLGAPLSITDADTKRLLALTDEDAMSAEQFRVLANRLVSLRRAIKLKVLHVTSSVIGEGKSLVASNLAVTLARRPNTRVLLLEGDLRRPSLPDVFGITDTVGIGQWWEEGLLAPTPQLSPVAGLPLHILFAGKVHRPTDLMHSPRLPEMLEELAQHFDWVIIDSPPLLPVVDSTMWARWADGTLMVMRAGVSNRKDVEKALATFDKARIVATVLNEAPEDGRGRYYHQYYRGSALNRSK